MSRAIRWRCVGGREAKSPNPMLFEIIVVIIVAVVALYILVALLALIGLPLAFLGDLTLLFAGDKADPIEPAWLKPAVLIFCGCGLTGLATYALLTIHY
jgi:hypothetical protein